MAGSLGPSQAHTWGLAWNTGRQRLKKWMAPALPMAIQASASASATHTRPMVRTPGMLGKTFTPLMYLAPLRARKVDTHPGTP